MSIENPFAPISSPATPEATPERAINDRIRDLHKDVIGIDAKELGQLKPALTDLENALQPLLKS